MRGWLHFGLGIFFAGAAFAAAPAGRHLPRLIDSQYEDWDKKFGVGNDDELRAALRQINPDEANRSSGWLLNHLGDWPNAMPVWAAIHREDALDDEAVGTLAGYLYVIKGPDAYVRFLSKADLQHLVFRDDRGCQYWQSNLEGDVASVLVELGRTDEALAWSKRAADDGGGSIAWDSQAEASLQANEPVDALRATDTCLKVYPRSVRTLLLRGLALKALGRVPEARAAFATATQLGPADEAARRAAMGEEHSVAEWVHFYSRKKQRDDGETLAHCGHYYLDLGLTDRAEACFALAEKIEPEPSMAMKLAHLAETAPDAAVAKTEHLLETDRHIHYLSLLAWLYLGYERKDEARKLVDEALRQDLWSQKANSILVQVCGASEDGLCVIEARWRQGFEYTHLPLPWAWHWLARGFKGQAGAFAQFRAVLTHQPRVAFVLPVTGLILFLLVATIAVLLRRRARARAKR